MTVSHVSPSLYMSSVSCTNRGKTMQIVEPRCANYSGHKWRAVCSAGYPILSDVDTILCGARFAQSP